MPLPEELKTKLARMTREEHANALREEITRLYVHPELMLAHLDALV